MSRTRNRYMKKKLESSGPVLGPYSPGIDLGDYIFLSGQIPLDPSSGELIPGPVENQAKAVLESIKNILAKANLTMDHIVKSTIFLTDLDYFQKVNQVYSQYFQEPYPARSTIQVAALPKGSPVEIEVIAKR
jgi:2-iminobutanoate/2-iminopropanoate deaminase